MKKMLIMAAVAIVTMTSCSDDSNSNTDNNNPAGTVLLKKIIRTSDDGTVTTSTFNYSGGKLSSITDNDGSSDTYTYNNSNQIVMIKHIGPNNFDQLDSFTYDENGRVSVYVRTHESTHLGTKYVLTYGTNGTVNSKVFSGTDTEQLNETQTNNLYTLTNGNVMNMDGDVKVWTYNNTVDPWDTIMGNSALNIAYGDHGVNNVTSFKRKNFATGGLLEHYEYTYTYNNGSNYPATEVEHDVIHNETTTTQYFYE